MKRSVTGLLVVMLALSACKGESLFDASNPDHVDRNKKLSTQDYENLLKPGEDPNVSFSTKGAAGPPLPDLAPILAAPPPPKLGQTKLVSITVTDDVPLKDVLVELARLADVDIEVDANITGGITFRAKERPFNEVIERIAKVAGLRYKMSNGVLRVERDTPYVEIYPIDFINIDRSTTSNVSISTNVLSGSDSGKGGGLNTGSSSAINAQSKSDFWAQFEEGVKQIIAYQPASMVSIVGGVSSTGTPTATTDPAAPAAAAPAPAASLAAGMPTGRSFYILNRQGATLTVAGTERQHELLRRFLKQVEASASSQVLIEAKIVEVSLDKEYQSGIDWNRIGGVSLSGAAGFGGVSDAANIATFSLDKAFGKGNGRIDLDLAVQLAETFGTTRTLSSPRLHAINNQQAVLTFAENQVYFQVKVDREQTSSTSTTNTTLTVNSEIKTVPIGIILAMQPSINLETDEVTLSVRPTLSRVTGSVSDPAVAFLVAEAGSDLTGVQSTVPVVEVRELDSILKLKSGQVMVIGGLMEDRSNSTDSGIPGARNVPVLGNLFGATDRNSETKELVIFIRATIVRPTGGAVPDADKALYQKFTTDPRPLEF